MTPCAVYGCPNNSSTSDPSILYYFFPKHPVITQQWITACWRPDQFDTTTARICSIHFDSDSYTSEYKMLDYLGSYTKMLKYDAVPTLYLPSTTPVIIKLERNINPQSNLMRPEEVKDIIVYEIQNTQVSNYDNENVQLVNDENLLLNGCTQTEVSTQTNTDNQNETVTECSEYMGINNIEDLNKLKDENENLKLKLEQLKTDVNVIKAKCSENANTLKKKNMDLKKLIQQLNTLRRNTMTIAEQKSILSKVFSESQIKILSGKKKIYWSNDDMAMGYTIRHMSNKRCYMYLSKNLHIPLPALSSIKRWATLKKSELEREDRRKDKCESN